MTTINPIIKLPPELILRILNELNIQSLVELSKCSKLYNEFIKCHQDLILISIKDKLGRSFNNALNQLDSIGDGYLNVQNWKDLCTYIYLLVLKYIYHMSIDNRTNFIEKNLKVDKPKVFERFVDTGATLTWRFKPDFDQNFVTVTAHQGGVKVFDLNDSTLLWQIPEDEVRPHAHLEYSNGHFCIDRFGNALEVWRRIDKQNEYLPVDQQVPYKRGEFTRIAILPHDRETRGFQLDYPHLSVVSSEGKGYLYDVSGVPNLLREVDIEPGAIGHLDQCSSAIVFSMGTSGYHFHSKSTGELMGKFPPENLSEENYFYAHHPKLQTTSLSALHNQHIQSIKLNKGILSENSTNRYRQPLPDLINDDWGAGMIDDHYFVGISRSGRLIICSDWQATLNDPSISNKTISILESETDDSRFDLGGWLSIKHNKVLFEVSDRIYILHLPSRGEILNEKFSPLIQTAPSNLYGQLPVPISYMSIHSDSIMSTYAKLTFNQIRTGIAKHIRILSFVDNNNIKLDKDKRWIDPQVPPNEDAHQSQLFFLN